MITQVNYRWDNQAGVEPGWYAESYAGESRQDDSQKVWFPVSVDEYAHEEWVALETALSEAFPGAKIVCLDD